jgi:hypothetical protein
MRAAPTCPRCGARVREPSAWSSAWQCDQHGEVAPLAPAYSPSRDGLEGLLRTRGAPVWLPWPLPAGWLVTGFAGVGDERTGTCGCAVALSGPNPCGGPGELLLVSEEPGIGLGARFAGLDGPDPGAGFATGPPHVFVRVDSHDFPLWHVDAPGRAAFAGEVKAHWLWAVLWPETAGLLLLESITLRDLRDPGQELDLPFGAPSPRLCGLTGG